MERAECNRPSRPARSKETGGEGSGYNGYMERASVSAAKNRLSALLDRVRHGATVVIEDRGTPVARLEPVGPGHDEDGSLGHLVRAGIVTPARIPGLPAILKHRPPKLRRGGSAVQALLDERAEGR